MHPMPIPSRRVRRHTSRLKADDIPHDPDLGRQMSRSENRKDTWAKLRVGYVSNPRTSYTGSKAGVTEFSRGRMEAQ